MGNRSMFVGLDVHKETIDVSIAEGARNGEVRHYPNGCLEHAMCRRWKHPVFQRRYDDHHRVCPRRAAARECSWPPAKLRHASNDPDVRSSHDMFVLCLLLRSR